MTYLQDLRNKQANNEPLTPLELAAIVFGMDAAAEELRVLREKAEAYDVEVARLSALITDVREILNV